MVILIGGAGYTGKTLLAQRLLEKYKYPYLSIDHLKMGLIRSGNTALTPLSDDGLLTEYLWPIVCEIIKTAIENGQNLVVEGCYIPFDYEKYFETDYLKSIKYLCLIMSEDYINNHFDDIKANANAIENRLCDDCSLEEIFTNNNKNLTKALEYGVNYVLIENDYLEEIKNFLEV